MCAGRRHKKTRIGGCFRSDGTDLSPAFGLYPGQKGSLFSKVLLRRQDECCVNEQLAPLVVMSGIDYQGYQEYQKFMTLFGGVRDKV